MTTKSVPTWEHFVAENLLQSGMFSGLCLFSNQQEPVYTYGALKNLDKVEIGQFFSAFTNRESEGNPSIHCLCIKDSTSKVTFRIYHRTHVSLYATTSGNQSGLIVSKLPHGIFVALFHMPVAAHKAITLVEDFTNKLRS